MIGSIRGVIVDRGSLAADTTEIVVEVGGIGYRLTVTASTLQALATGALAASSSAGGSSANGSTVGREATSSDDGSVLLHVHHHFWEADQKLFGFATKDERNAFEGLLAAHKVGPALALAIIGTYPPVQLAQVLADDDIDALCAVPGVGKKTAQRLLVDLKSTLVFPVLESDDASAIDLTGTASASQALTDVREALANLGYGNDEIKTVVKDVQAEGVLESDDAGDLLKRALRRLAGA